MGNIISGSTDQYICNNTNSNSQKEIVLDDLDTIELIKYIKKLNPKALNVDSDFQNLLKNINLENTQLIPMTIELYEKMEKVVPLYKPDNNNIYKRRMIYIKPQFGSDQVINRKIEINNDFIDQKLNLDDIPEPKYKLKIDNIDILEFVESFRTPTTKKDMLGISKKIMINLPNYHKIRLINAYNKIFTHKFDPTISFGRSSYIYKIGKGGAKDDIRSFREIITIPTVVNHFHRILALRLTDYLNKNDYIDKTIQKGGITGTDNGILVQIYKVKNIIKHANDNNNKLAVLFLDISNAFGSLSRQKLIEIMKNYHIEDQFINYFREYYNNFKYYGQTRDWITDELSWKNGLIQGCPMSPLLFVLALNYILSYLDKKYNEIMGYKINDTIGILFTAFIDDICILCKDMNSLEEMYTKLKFMFNCLGLTVNKSKCAIMKINCSNNNDNGNENYNEDGFDDIKITNTYKYLGEYLSADGSTAESFKQFISMLGKKLFALDKKKNIDNNTRLGFFAKCMLPWIQRKMAIMYDLSKNDRLKIIYLIKKYLNKWGNEDNVRIFTFISDLISDTDKVVRDAKFDHSESLDDIELSNNIMNEDDDNLKFTYKKINEDPNVEIL